ncbi:DUF5327 family protein [Alkalihalobacillus hemicellulosilyticus]|uniref:Uncharacterized protein n=1 Tax=Halalkalibacter hemicellulosilyticusJCM 9152 TaxID=1236971 RepID=W4QCK0_9BACI|nr:DUF5327 family protein [Halalkalibacter hemicellulosilyticus]GAE29760.1 hypothetical protein JCM9152_1141 [Halalkalibacter hemicellulosilyticusJCM 9152]
MNVSAKKIVEQLEQELALLKRATEHGQANIVKEKAIVIETYCRLLKGTDADSARPMQPLPPLQSQPSIAQTHVASPASSMESSSSTSPKSNLLDF